VPHCRGTLVVGGGGRAAVVDRWGSAGLDEVRWRLSPAVRQALCDEILLAIAWCTQDVRNWPLAPPRNTLAVRMRTAPAGRAPAALAALVLAAVPLAGCARTAEERQLEAMRDQIEELQTERDRADRETLAPEAADTQSATAPDRAPVLPQSRPAARPPPPPRVVSVGGEPLDYDDSPDTDDPSPRPTLRAIGRAIPDDGASVAGASSPGATRWSALDPGAKLAYDAALSLVKARQYDRANDALAAFLVKWPDHPYADNALFWRGECYFAKGDYLRASEQFEGVITRFPAGNKAPDALLELGVCRQKLGDPTAAKQVFDRLAQQYAASDAARRIPPVTVPAATPPGRASEDHR
jgi:tol-pal system protein YbgF